MPLPPYVYIPLASAALYAVAALLLKRGMQSETGPWRTTFISNAVMAIIFLPMWMLGSQPATPVAIWHAALCAGLFLTGQIFTFIALGRGDVSVATPVMGTKVILVALFTVLVIGTPIPPVWWLAAGLTTVATALLRGPGGGVRARDHLHTIIAAVVSSLSFALTDVLIQKWVPQWEVERFIPAMFVAVSVLSLGLIPFFSAPLRQIPATTWRWLLPGAMVLSVQALGMAAAIGKFGHATVVNIAYSSRGLWSVVLVWALGGLFQNMESREHGPRVMTLRLLGSMLIIAAIWLVVPR